ncbi:MAG: CvpA family protein [Lachnospiraceae bacterium]|nr:CvpA family protein [Lachnospiraceae bacterium]
MGINFVFLIAVMIIIVSIVAGASRGFLKSSLSLAALILSFVLVSVFHPFVTGLLKNTGLDEWIAGKVDSAIEGKLQSMATGELSEGAFTEENGMLTLKKDVTLPMDVTLPDGTVLAAGTTVPAGTKLPAGIGLEEIKKQVDTELSALQQSELIERLPLPASLRDSLMENNNTAIYERLGVESFTDYIGSFVAGICLNIVGYILTFLVIFLALHVAFMAFNVVDRIPIVHGINHFAGAVLGIFKGFLLLEILFLLLVPFSATEFGEGILAQINANGFLSALYHNNFLMKLLMGVVGKVVL